MAQETRKDPRAKVLTMTVRYKSATLDEFIEHHSYDVSRGGMFIKTPSPFPPGTLLKFEVKIADDKKLMQGVGRVVWKREAPESAADKPAGMGVKFIKVDEDSKRVIGQLVSSRGDDSKSAFDDDNESGPPKKAQAPRIDPKSEPKEPATKPAARKATMIGLGALADESSTKASTPPTGSDDNFFPQTDSEGDLPAPEDRTVMKQAAELLEDALREAGGSVDDISDTGKKSEPPRSASEPPRPSSKAPESEPPASSKADDEKSDAAESKKEAAPVTRPSKDSEAPAASRPSVRPSSAPSALEQAGEEGGGGGRAILLVLAALAVGGGVYAFTKQQEAPLPEPATLEEPAAVEEPAAPEPTPAEPEAEEAPDAAMDGEAANDAASEPDEEAAAAKEKEQAKKEAEEKAAAEKAAKAEAAAKKAARSAPPKPRPRPTKPATPKPPAPKPEATKPATPAPAAPKPKPAEPKPAAPAPVDDNPY